MLMKFFNKKIYALFGCTILIIVMSIFFAERNFNKMKQDFLDRKKEMDAYYENKCREIIGNKVSYISSNNNDCCFNISNNSYILTDKNNIETEIIVNKNPICINISKIKNIE